GLRAGRRRVHRGRRDPMAARRARPPRACRRERSDGALGGGHRGPGHGAGARGARRSLLAARRARRRARHHTRHDACPRGARGAGVAGVPVARPRRGDGARRPSPRDPPASGRRCRRQRFPDAIPGRPARHPGRASARGRDHGARGRAPCRARRRLLVVAPRAGRRAPRRARVHTAAPARLARGGVRAVEAGGGDGALGAECAMKRTWTIIGVADVPGSFKWYQSLLGRPETPPGHDYFGQILDTDGTVLLCLHRWGAHEHPSLMSPIEASRGNGLLLFFRVDDYEEALQRARVLVDRLEEEPHVNPNTGTREFSLRDPDGYYVTISALP